VVIYEREIVWSSGEGSIVLILANFLRGTPF